MGNENQNLRDKGGEAFSAKVLAIDDDAVILQILQESLESYGFTVEVVNDGSYALERVLEFEPELILLDILLGEMDGLLLCMELKKRKETRGIPVIFLSGIDDVEEKARCFRVGAVDYVVKPVDAKELALRMRYQIEIARKWVQLEERSRAYSLLMREMFEALDEAIVICRALVDGGVEEMDIWVEYVNRSFCNLFSRDANEVIGKRMFGSGLLRAKPEIETLALRMLKKFFELGQRVQEEIYLARERKWMRLQMMLMEGRFLSLRINDITEEKRLEEQKRANVEAVLRSEKISALGTLMAGMCHEINNPNNVITMNVPLLERIWEEILPIVDKEVKSRNLSKICNMPAGEVLEQVPKLLAGMRRAALRIRDVVKLVRDYTQSGVERAQLKPLNLNEAICDAVELVSNRLVGFAEIVELDLEEDLPEVAGDFRRVEQVLVNLLLNAGESLEGNGGRVYVRTRRVGETGKVELVIEDEGSGIPREILDRIGTPFVTTKGQRGGMGLGISICQRILQDHQAKMRIESEVGKGTRVTVIFPRCTIPLPIAHLAAKEA